MRDQVSVARKAPYEALPLLEFPGSVNQPEGLNHVFGYWRIGVKRNLVCLFTKSVKAFAAPVMCGACNSHAIPRSSRVGR